MKLKYTTRLCATMSLECTHKITNEVDIISKSCFVIAKTSNTSEQIKTKISNVLSKRINRAFYTFCTNNRRFPTDFVIKTHLEYHIQTQADLLEQANK